jgi:hypothetical protein
MTGTLPSLQARSLLPEGGDCPEAPARAVCA